MTDSVALSALPSTMFSVLSVNVSAVRATTVCRLTTLTGPVTVYSIQSPTLADRYMLSVSGGVGGAARTGARTRNARDMSGYSECGSRADSPDYPRGRTGPDTIR